jgi:hypothetical protein
MVKSGSERQKSEHQKFFLGQSEHQKSKRSQHQKIRTSKVTYGVWPS